jgi:hypothetical protein
VVILKCVILVMLVIVGLMVYAATRPSTFTIQRSIAIAAPMEKIYPFISDLHNWPLWAPQDNEDPSMQRTFSGASAGQGASSHWTGKGSGGSEPITTCSS